MGRIEGGRLDKRVFLVLAVVVVAMVLLWSDDEQPSDKEKIPSVTETREPPQTSSAPWQFRPTPGELTRQPPRGLAYPPPQGVQPAPGYAYSGGATGPYATPYTQPIPYDGYGFQPQQGVQEYGTAPQPPQYPGSDLPYGYSDTPAFRYRPLDEKETSRRYHGNYPRQNYSYPGAPPPGYGPKR